MCTVLGLLALFLSSVLAQNTTHVPFNDVETELEQQGDYTIFLGLLRSTGAIQALKQANHITLFAPTDDGLNSLPAGQLESLQANIFLLNSTLFYHMILKKSINFQADDQDSVVTSSTDLPIRINVYRLLHVIAAEGVNITHKNIRVANGRIHGIDGLMSPPQGDVGDIAAKRGDMNTFSSLAQQAGIIQSILDDQNITVFVPTDAAFQKLSPDVMSYLTAHPTAALKETLEYHLIPQMTLYSIGMRHTMTFHSGDGHNDNLMVLEDNNGGIFINHAQITERDISATNGVIHMIDDVLIPARVLLEIESHGIVIG